jgi:hypothetical protein
MTELLVSSLAQTDALAKLLIEKGLIAREEFMQKISQERATYQRMLQNKGNGMTKRSYWLDLFTGVTSNKFKESGGKVSGFRSRDGLRFKKTSPVSENVSVDEVGLNAKKEKQTTGPLSVSGFSPGF